MYLRVFVSVGGESFLLVSQSTDVVVYLCRNSLEDGIPEAFRVHHLPIMPINYCQVHSIFRLVQRLAIYLSQQRQPITLQLRDVLSQ